MSSKILIALALILSAILAGVATARDLGHRNPQPQAPAKGDEHLLANPVADSREGGETIADAIPIP